MKSVNVKLKEMTNDCADFFLSAIADKKWSNIVYIIFIWQYHSALKTDEKQFFKIHNPPFLSASIRFAVSYFDFSE